MNWLAKIGSVPVVEKIVDKGLSRLESEMTRYRNVEEELGRLRRTSGRINCLLTDAEERRYIEDKSVMDWLSNLKSVSFDTDDLLDEYQTAINVHNHSANVAPSRKRKWYQIELPSMGPEWGPLQRRRFASEIDKIDKRLDEIAKSRKNLRLKGEDGKRRGSFHPSAWPFQTGPCHDRASIIGRKNDKNEIVDLLITAQTSASASRPTVVPIHGAAGIGKTTLAQMVYNDPRLDCFNIKAWVCLTERCDVSTAMKEIYETMTGQRWDCGDFGRLQDSLRDHLKTREDNKFLLVIDNFWAIDLHFWEMLRVPLLAGGDGSKVLITTRYERICQIMQGVIQRPSLTGLDEEDCWQLIQSLALPQGIINHDCEKLVSIGKEIAIRCHGSPMAAKALGAVLNGRSEEEWSDVLSEMPSSSPVR